MLWRRLGLILLISPALTLAALGIVLGPPGALVVLPLTAAIFAYVVVFARAEHTASDPAGPPTPAGPDPGGDGSEPGSGYGAGASARRRGARAALVAAVVTAGAVLVVAGLVAVAGPATTPILLWVVLAAAPWVWRRLRPQRGRHPDTHTGPDRVTGHTRAGVEAGTEPRPAVTEARRSGRGLESLSTRALCAAWQRSYFDLLHAPDRWARDELVERRRRCLDELAHRDPAALDRWVAADPRAAGADPHRHFAPAESATTESTTSGSAPHHSSHEHPSRYRRNPWSIRPRTQPHPPGHGPTSQGRTP